MRTRSRKSRAALGPGLVERGFTLVELLIGATLSAAIMAAVLSSYIYLGRNLGRLANQQTLETEARRTLAQFTQDVQSATGLTGIPSATSVSLTVPTGTGTKTITYYYNRLLLTPSTETDDVVVNSATIKMRRQSLTRCVYDGSNVTAQTLLRNVTDNDSSTVYDLFLRYFDSSGSPYDNGASPYTTVTNYSSGIKQLSLQFSTQLGNAGNGTQTLVYQGASSRLVLRNRAFLP